MRRLLPVAGLVTGIWAVLPPYTGPDLNTETRVEVVDHVVPGVVLLAVVVAAVLMDRRGAGTRGPWLLAGGMVILLAGIWMTATHVPLIAQANRGQIGDPSMGAALYHTLPGLVVVALGLTWSAAYWRETP